MLLEVINQKYLVIAGLTVFSAIGLLGCLWILNYLFQKILNIAGKLFKNLWMIVEFAYYKREFKKYLNEKYPDRKTKYKK